MCASTCRGVEQGLGPVQRNYEAYPSAAGSQESLATGGSEDSPPWAGPVPRTLVQAQHDLCNRLAKRHCDCQLVLGRLLRPLLPDPPAHLEHAQVILVVVAVMVLPLFQLTVVGCHLASLTKSCYGPMLTLSTCLQFKKPAGESLCNGRPQAWSFVHSGPNSDKPSYCGVLLCFRGSGVIRFDEVVAGRLLRVQIACSNRPVPLEAVVMYNHYMAEAPNDESDALLQARHHVWTALDRTLSSIPRRHALLVLGDFNTHLQCTPPLLCRS